MAVHQLCEQCGTGFNVSPSRVGLVRYCGPACRHAAQHVKSACECCGVAFETRRCRPQRFCSPTCRVVGLSPPVLLDCAECGTKFRVPPARKETAKFCSRECTNKNEQFKALQAAQQAGEKAWRWNGGVTGEGYVRNVGGKRGRLAHRIVVANEMATRDPAHPFLMLARDVPVLRPDIEVHHVDRNRANNAPCNLLAVTKAAHAAIHHRGIKPPRHECWPSNPSHW